MPKDDPLERLLKTIDDRIEAAFTSRDQRANEEKDPWAKLAGIIDRAIDKRFAELGEGVEEGKRKLKGDNPDDEERPKLGILGL